MIQELTWKEAREEVAKANPILAKVIDKISPSKDYTLFKVRYPFGAMILENGVIKLPLADNSFTSIDHSDIPRNVKNKLSYSPIPMALIVTKSVEVYVEPEGRLTTLAVLPTGTIFGLWETLDPPTAIFVSRLWNMSAGGRLLFFLPRVSDSISHKRLQSTYRVKTPVPQNLADHWEIFKEIAYHPDTKCDWHCDLFFFSNKWLEEHDDPDWLAFRYLLLNTAWEQSRGWRSKIYFDIIWESFSLAIVKRNLKPTQNQINTIKHLIGIAAGIFPGFSLAMDDLLAPISLLQKVYVEDYGLKDYAPLIMQPYRFSIEKPEVPVYYSLNFPTQLDYAPVNIRSTRGELREIMRLNETMQRRMQIDNRPIFNFIRAMHYEYFHSEKDVLEQIKLTSDIPNYDPLLKNLLQKYVNKRFPEKSSFLRGCVLIRLNNND